MKDIEMRIWNCLGVKSKKNNQSYNGVFCWLHNGYFVYPNTTIRAPLFDRVTLAKVVVFPTEGMKERQWSLYFTRNFLKDTALMYQKMRVMLKLNQTLVYSIIFVLQGHADLNIKQPVPYTNINVVNGALVIVVYNVLKL